MSTETLHCTIASTCPLEPRCQKKWFAEWERYCPRAKILATPVTHHVKPPAPAPGPGPEAAAAPEPDSVFGEEIADLYREMGLPVVPGAGVRSLPDAAGVPTFYVPLATGQRLILDQLLQDRFRAEVF
mgnify:CR=1 FL=1